MQRGSVHRKVKMIIDAINDAITSLRAVGAEHQLFSKRVPIWSLFRKLKEETQARGYLYLTKTPYRQEEAVFNEWLKIEGRAVEKWRFQRMMTAWGNGMHSYCHIHIVSTQTNVRHIGNREGHKRRPGRRSKRTTEAPHQHVRAGKVSNHDGPPQDTAREQDRNMQSKERGPPWLLASRLGQTGGHWQYSPLRCRAKSPPSRREGVSRG